MDSLWCEEHLFLAVRFYENGIFFLQEIMIDLLVIYRVIGNVQKVIWSVPPLCDNVRKSLV